jgi:hypothetical protein
MIYIYIKFHVTDCVCDGALGLGSYSMMSCYLPIVLASYEKMH